MTIEEYELERVTRNLLVKKVYEQYLKQDSRLVSGNMNKRSISIGYGNVEFDVRLTIKRKPKRTLAQEADRQAQLAQEEGV